eukprot:XP_001703941.1 Hypothetical protein GL50803_19490 [Giardia lamblia ATCC 50803]
MHSPPGVTVVALFWNMYWLAVLQAVHTPSLAAVHITLHYHPLSPSITHYHPLYSIHYPSHAFPLHTNHQQRKPTRPPTTAMTATEIPAMAPVLSPLLLAPEDTHLPLSRLKPLLHSPHTPSITQLLQLVSEHSTHPLPSLLGFLLLSQEVQTAGVMPPSDRPAGAVHCEQPSTPTYALAVP